MRGDGPPTELARDTEEASRAEEKAYAGLAAHICSEGFSIEQALEQAVSRQHSIIPSRARFSSQDVSIPATPLHTFLQDEEQFALPAVWDSSAGRVPLGLYVVSDHRWTSFKRLRR